MVDDDVAVRVEDVKVRVVLEMVNVVTVLVKTVTVVSDVVDEVVVVVVKVVAVVVLVDGQRGTSLTASAMAFCPLSEEEASRNTDSSSRDPSKKNRPRGAY